MQTSHKPLTHVNEEADTRMTKPATFVEMLERQCKELRSLNKELCTLVRLITRVNLCGTQAVPAVAADRIDKDGNIGFGVSQRNFGAGEANDTGR